MASSTPYKAAQGLRLEPIKMSKNVPAVVTATAETTVVEVKSGYRPPQARPKKDEPLDFGERSFPTLGSSVNKIKAVEAKGPNFKDKIMNLIAKDQMDEEERLRAPENDPFKMSAAQLTAGGYAMLQIPNTAEEKSKFVKKFIERMNRFEEVPVGVEAEFY